MTSHLHKHLSFIILLIITKTAFSQEISLDSLAKQHKKIAILPVRVIYNYKKMPDGLSMKDIRNKEYEDGFLLQKKFNDHLRLKKESVLVDIQSFDETNGLLAENEITLQDIKDLPSDFICEALKVDGIIEYEIRLNTHLTDNERYGLQAMAITSIMLNPINAVGLLRGVRKQRNYTDNRDDKAVYSKIRISDGVSGEIIKEFSLAFEVGIFNSSDKVIENMLWQNFKKSPYYKK